VDLLAHQSLSVDAHGGGPTRQHATCLEGSESKRGGLRMIAALVQGGFSIMRMQDFALEHEGREVVVMLIPRNAHARLAPSSVRPEAAKLR